MPHPPRLPRHTLGRVHLEAKTQQTYRNKPAFRKVRDRVRIPKDDGTGSQTPITYAVPGTAE